MTNKEIRDLIIELEIQINGFNRDDALELREDLEKLSSQITSEYDFIDQQ